MGIRRSALFAAALAASALAGLPAEAAKGGYKSLDSNNDGVIDRQEVTSASDQLFQQLDANHDGYLSQDELASGHRRAKAKTAAASPAPDQEAKRAAAAAKRYARLDTDGDGRISADEFRTRRLALFDRRDKNKDGKLAPDEMPQRHAKAAG